MRAGHPRSTTHAGLRRTAIPLALCLNRAYGCSRRYAALDDARGVCTGNVSHCGHVRDSALPGVCTRLCVLLRPCARFCVGRMYAFMRPLATERAILRRAYVRVYASPCDPARNSAPGLCTRLCVPLRPCAQFCARHMYTLMRPIAAMCLILYRRAYVHAYASSCDRARNSAPGVCTRLCLRAATLPGISKYQCIPLRAFAYTCARKSQDIFSHASNQNFSSGKMPARMPMRQVTSGSTICAISRLPTRLISIAM